ncbi:MAG TPA: DUF2249 domain-containing protein [Puia sp.]|nr:DUF2249 domain-containing protein [Puia sp.]
MTTINANTKIATILRQNPAAMEAIIALSPKFSRLRNPILRRLMAGRTTIAMASRIGGCTVDDFFTSLAKLGFVVDRENKEEDPGVADHRPPGPPLLQHLGPDQVLELDVRPLIAAGNDPLKAILEKIRMLEPGMVLKIINSFTPLPLIALLSKKGFRSWTDNIEEDVVNTYFLLDEQANADIPIGAPDTSAAATSNEAAWSAMMKRFAGNLVSLDVRELQMPLPMMAILETLDDLPPGNGLFVHHKRIPVFLLPELAERGFTYRIHEAEGEVQLLIFKSPGDEGR